jgi:Xaa-Pro aminopeptidase
MAEIRKIESMVQMEEDFASSMSTSVSGIKNVVVRELLRSLALDSQKHAGFYKAILVLLKGDSPPIDDDDYAEIEEAIKKHIELESDAVRDVRRLIRAEKDSRVKRLLSEIYADETRHHALLKNLLELVVRQEGILDEDSWNTLWKDVPTHGVPIDRSKLEFVDGASIMTDLRIVKSSEEIELIRRAGKVADLAMEAAIKAVRPGVTETEIAAEAEYAMRKNGAEEFYRTYIATGPRSSIAHGLVGHRKVQNGDLVMIDLHPTVNSYHADICRTICVGKPSEKQRKAFDVYLRAQRAAIEAVNPNTTMTKVENVMHEIFGKEGYEAYFLGPPIHGVGLEFEEPPLPAGHAFFHGEEPKDELKPGMVLSIGNCGLYLGGFGVRIEDTVTVTDRGYEELTRYNKSLQ